MCWFPLELTLQRCCLYFVCHMLQMFATVFSPNMWRRVGCDRKCLQPSATVYSRWQRFATVCEEVACTLHSTFRSIQFILHTPHFPLYLPHFTLYTRTLHTALHTLSFSLLTPHSILRTEHFHFTLLTSLLTLLTSHFSLLSSHSALHSVHCTLYTLHFAFSTLHLTLYIPLFAHVTSHFGLRILHFTLVPYTPHCTLQFTLYTLHSLLKNPLSSRAALGIPTLFIFRCLQCTRRVTGQKL